MRSRREITKQTAAGVMRCCKVCGQWLPQRKEHYYQVPLNSTSPKRGEWSTRCKTCERERARDSYRNGAVESAKSRKTQEPKPERAAYGSAKPTWDFANAAAAALARALGRK